MALSRLPAGVQILFDVTETEDPGVIESPMEKGPHKLRVAEQRLMTEQAVTLYFPTHAAMVAFDAWYLETIKRIDWFDYFDPRSRILRTVRFKGGARGPIKALASRFARSSRTATLEFLA